MKAEKVYKFGIHSCVTTISPFASREHRQLCTVPSADRFPKRWGRRAVRPLICEALPPQPWRTATLSA
eukprot:6179513-Pleurochrysis_carterae.AAC.3